MTYYQSQISLILLVLSVGCQAPEQANTILDTEQVIEMDSLTGLIIDENYQLVRAQCTTCHSAKLITQNSASREGWEQMIRWMQKDQGLWDLGQNESLILDYLTEHYGIRKKGRRASLTDIEWYTLGEQP